METSLTTLAMNFPKIQTFFFDLMAFLGLVAVISSLMHQAAAGKRNQGLLPETIAGIVFGSLMFGIPSVANIFASSLFGTSADTQIVTSYSAVTGADAKVRESVHAVVVMAAVIGWFAIGRGLWIGRVGAKYQQQGWQGASLTFIIAGTIATNLYVFADILGGSVGISGLGTDYFKF